LLRRFRQISLITLASVLTALAVTVAAYAAAAADTVAVTAGKPGELRFTLSKKTVKKGAVVFKVTNKGSLGHDFKVAGKKTPLLAKGKAGTLKVTFTKPGKYAYLCTVPGHAAGGMKGTLTVK
jgi:uncharacterized cupredoxin-like copper-binding protein